MIGKVVKKDGYPNGHDFTILGDDGKEYFAHAGDLKKNEDFLYEYQPEDLEEGETVFFKAIDPNNPIYKRLRAIHVEKVEEVE